MRSSLPSRLTPVVLALLALTLAGRTLTLSRARPFPMYDETEYLRMTRDFHRFGGVAATIGAYARGEYKEEGKHPLYPLLVTPFVDGTAADYARAKLASLAGALLLASIVFFLSRKLWGEDAALFATGVLCLAPSTAYLARQSLGDPLFTALYCASLLILAGAGTSLRRWLAFGACSGLAYLAKGDGHLVFLSALAVGFATFGRAFLKRPHLYAAAAVFTLIASPLLLRNERVWGQAFYNYNGKVLWMDELKQAKPWRGGLEWYRLSARWYFAHHDAGQVANRLAAGAAGFPPLLAQTIGGPIEAEPWRTASGAVLLALAAFGAALLWRARKRAELLALLTTSAVIGSALAWMFFLDGGVMRYVFPLAAALAPLAALGACELGRRSFEKRWPLVLRGALAAACLAALPGNLEGLKGNPLGYCGVSPQWAETSAWIKARGVDGVLIDPASLYAAFDAGLDVTRSYLFREPDADIRAYAERTGTRYALLDRHVNQRDGSRGKYGPLDAHGPLSFLGWPRCFHDSLTPSVFLIYSKDCAKARR